MLGPELGEELAIEAVKLWYGEHSRVVVLGHNSKIAAPPG